jgi:predicted permease
MNSFRWIRRSPRRQRFEAEMTDEMQAHVEMQAARHRAAGMDPDEARFAALRQFGNVASAQERVRAQRRGLWWDHLKRDLHHGLRLLGKAPGMSAVIVLSLAVGIGVNAVIFSWIDCLLFRPLPGVANTSRLLLVEPRSETGSYPGMSWPEYREVRERLPSFEELAAFRMLPVDYGAAGHEERAYAQLVSGNYFSTLELHPQLGRLLRPDEAATPGGAPVAVISHDFWQTRLAGAADILGREIRLNNRMVTIVGVAPPGFRGTVIGLSFDLWLPATLAPVLLGGSTELEQRDDRVYSAMGRLRPGTSIAQAGPELDTAMRQLAANYPASNGGVGAVILPFWQTPRGAAGLLLGGLEVLQGFMLLLLLAVCANAGNLLLARASARRREIGVRLALGARPGQIVRMLLTESAVLGALASGGGVLLAEWGTGALRAVPLPGGFPFKFDTDLRWDGLLLSVLAGLGCALLFGLAPALQAARTDSQLALRSARPAAGRSRLRSTLVALEVALALLVLVGAAMFARNFLESRTAAPGFKAEGVLLAGYDLAHSGYDRATGLARMDELLTRLASTPGVDTAAIASWVPLDFHAMPLAAFKLDGRDKPGGGLDRALTYNVTPGYFRTMEIPLVAGRDFAALTDTALPRQAVVNEEFVRRFLGDTPPLGHVIGGKNAGFEIVGVVRNSLYESFGEPAKPIIYFSYRDRFGLTGRLHVRTRGPEAALAPVLRRIVRETNPSVALFDVQTLTEHVDRNLFFRRIPARMFAGLGPLILLIAAIGMYAVVANSVAQRTTEIGVRLALGAAPGRVVRQILGESLRLVWLGLVPAWLIAVVVMLHVQAGALNLSVIVGVPALLVGVAALAAWLPARRAARVDPVIALRAE